MTKKEHRKQMMIKISEFCARRDWMICDDGDQFIWIAIDGNDTPNDDMIELHRSRFTACVANWASDEAKAAEDELNKFLDEEKRFRGLS